MWTQFFNDKKSTFLFTIALGSVHTLTVHAQDVEETEAVANSMTPIEWIAIIAIILVLGAFGIWWHRSRKYSTTDWGVHTVQENETISEIADIYATTWDVLARANKIPAPYELTPGMSISVPVLQEVIDAAMAEDANMGMPQTMQDTQQDFSGGSNHLASDNFQDGDASASAQSITGPLADVAQKISGGKESLEKEIEGMNTMDRGRSERKMGDVVTPTAPEIATPQSIPSEEHDEEAQSEGADSVATQEKPSVASLAREMQKKHTQNDDLVFATRKKKLDVSWMREDEEDYDSAVDPAKQQQRARMTQFIIWSLVVLGVVALALNILSRVRSQQEANKEQVSIVTMSEDDAAQKESAAQEKEKQEQEQKDAAAAEDATEVVREDLTVAVLNGGAPAGMAGQITTLFSDATYKTQSAANANNDYDTTTIYYSRDDLKNAAQDAKKILIDEEVLKDATLAVDEALTGDADADVLVVLGTDITKP